jgi:hypothetical protein
VPGWCSILPDIISFEEWRILIWCRRGPSDSSKQSTNMTHTEVWGLILFEWFPFVLSSYLFVYFYLGFRFSTYASWWIKQSVSRSIAEKSRIVRLPVHIHDMMVSISKVEKHFFSQYNRKPTSEELATRLALPLQKVELLVKCAREVILFIDFL